MEVNLYVVFGVLCRIVSVLLIALIVVPIQLREFRVGRDSLMVYRWLLFGMSLAFISLSVIPVIYQVGRIDSQTELDLQNLASVSGNLAVLVLSSLYSAIYILANRRKD